MPGQADLAQKSARAISGAAHGNATSQSSNLGNLLNARSSVAALKATAAQLTAPAPTNLTGLPDRLKMGVEALSGLAMDDVRVHRNSALPAQMQAHAFAQGTDIHLAPGQERHLPHEAWHVVQQKQGRVRATTQLKGGVGVNDDVGLEREADSMGTRAAQATTLALQRFCRTTPKQVQVAQRMDSDDEDDGDRKKVDRRDKGPPKRRGGHKGEHPLPIEMQNDPNYAAWYHQLKQKNPGFLQRVLGQQISAAYNIDSKGERLLRPHWLKDKEAREQQRKARSARAVHDSSDSSEDSDSEGEALTREERADEAIGELERLVGLLRMGAPVTKKMAKTAAEFLEEFGDMPYAVNKYRLVKMMFDVPDENMPSIE